MNWDAVGATGEIAGVVAVLITLVYLARQIRQSNKQVLLGSFQNTFDALNGWCAMVSESGDLAPIILLGRDSYGALNDAQRLRFDHVHIQLLNIIESHHFQVHHTAIDEEYRSWAIANLEGNAGGYLGHPGTREFWGTAESFFPPEVRQLVNRSIAQVSEAGA
jgi:hypothetical protein